MTDGTDWWWPLLGMVALGWVILATLDPFNRR